MRAGCVCVIQQERRTGPGTGGRAVGGGGAGGEGVRRGSDRDDLYSRDKPATLNLPVVGGVRGLLSNLKFPIPRNPRSRICDLFKFRILRTPADLAADTADRCTVG